MGAPAQTRRLAWLAIVVLAVGAASCRRSPWTEARPPRVKLLVAAASSLTDAMTAIGEAYAAQNPGCEVRINAAGSGALQQQIEQGAPVDVFASASPKEIDALTRQGLIDSADCLDVAGNHLVLIAPPESPLRGWADLARSSVRRLAISNPDSVPSGRYARQTLQSRRLWGAVARRTVFGESARQTLQYVAAGDVDAGVVFTTDAIREGARVKVVASAAPGADHAPIVYPAAALKRSDNLETARRFVAFLKGPTAQAILARCGFTAVGPVR